MLYVGTAVELKVLKGVQHARANVARMVLFDKDSHTMHFLINDVKENDDFALFSPTLPWLGTRFE